METSESARKSMILSLVRHSKFEHEDLMGDIINEEILGVDVLCT